MTTEMIEQFIENKNRKGTPVGIHFKERNSIKGLFIRSGDYDELKSKNLWRIVSDTKIEEWNRTKNMDLPRIFNGLSFTRLTDHE